MTHFADSKSRRPEKAGESALIDREKLLAEIEKGEAAIAEGRVLLHEEAKGADVAMVKRRIVPGGIAS